MSKPKDEIYVNFFAEVFSSIKSTINNEQNHGDIVTTIEPNTQHTLEDELGEAFVKWKADEAGGIIMNPATGEIYAMVGYPNFDLNKLLIIYFLITPLISFDKTKSVFSITTHQPLIN